MNPMGSNFALIGEDGIIRIFGIEGDEVLRKYDREKWEGGMVEEEEEEGRKNIRNTSPGRSPKRSPRRSLSLSSRVKMLGSLRGHQTGEGAAGGLGFDIQYSNIGDRMLSFGTDECKMNVWSWKIEEGGRPDFGDVGRIVIWVRDPYTVSGNTTGGGSQRYRTELNCAAWTCDDAMVVTAQCTGNRKDMEEEKKRGGDHHRMARRFNQLVRVWDSRTGEMLACIHAHTDKVAKIMPHPTLPKVFLTAGFDGYLHVWDLEARKEKNPIFSHKNDFRHGMVNNVPGDRYRAWGEDVMVQYSEGDWSVDGRGVVVGDHAGRFTVVDCFQEGEIVRMQRNSAAIGGGGGDRGGAENRRCNGGGRGGGHQHETGRHCRLDCTQVDEGAVFFD